MDIVVVVVVVAVNVLSIENDSAQTLMLSLVAMAMQSSCSASVVDLMAALMLECLHFGIVVAALMVLPLVEIHSHLAEAELSFRLRVYSLVVAVVDSAMDIRSLRCHYCRYSD